MVDSQHANLQWKISVNSTPRTIFSDASKKNWSAACQEITIGGRRPSVEKAWHINVLELEAMTLAFTENGSMASIRQSLSSKVISKSAIDLILNAGRTGSQSNYESTWRK